MYIKQTASVLTGLVLLLTCTAQEKYHNKKINVAAPNTAALGKFISYPVDLYTGLPSINIPLHEIKLKGVSVPLSLSYHASGIRVDEVAGNAGAGWALNAGGIINIQANGVLDEISGFGAQHPEYQKVKNNSLQSGYTGQMVSCFNLETSEDKTELYTGGDIAYLRNIGRGIDDSEADMYSFRFGSRSGRFFEDESGVFRTVPYSMLKIERVMDGANPSGYTIREENGTVYEFRLRETSYNSITNNCAPTAAAQTGMLPWGRSYNLTKITTPFGETIRLYYTTLSSTYMTQASTSRARFINQTLCSQMNANGLGYYYYCGSVSNVAVYQNYLDSIISSDHTGIYFSYHTATRKDLPGAKTLFGITVKNRVSNEIVKSFSLVHDYYESASPQSTNPEHFRLRLKQIVPNGMPPYSFEYEGGTLPPRLSYAQDYYGYFNGKDNPSLFIKDEWNRFDEGGDRKVDEQYLKTGVLNKITWPTGGFTTYQYESNQYRVTEPTVEYEKKAGPYTLYSQPDQTVTGPVFTFPANGRRASVVVTNTYNGTQTHNDHCIVHLFGPNGYHRQYTGTPATPIEENLSPGNYYFQIENVGSTYSGSAYIFWFEENTIPPHNEPGGGLRIREINSFTEPGQLTGTRRFEYLKPGTTESSGKAMYRPVFLESKQEDNMVAPSANCMCTALPECPMLVQHTNSLVPLNFSNGNSVAYTDVTDYYTDKTKGGYTHSRFIASAGNSVNGVAQFPQAPQINYDWANGQLLEKNDYSYENGSYRQVTKTENIYNYTDFQPTVNINRLFTGYSVKTALWKPPMFCNNCNCNTQIGNIMMSNIAYGIASYKHYSSWHRLDKTIETRFGSNNTTFSAVNEFYYDSPEHLLPTKKVTYNSKGHKITERFTYPGDYAGLTASNELTIGINRLKTLGVLNAEIEKTVWRSDNSNNADKATDARFNIYDAQLPLPKKMMQMHIGSPLSDFSTSAVQGGSVTADPRYEPVSEYSIDPANGNILEELTANEIPDAYIWDYMQRYVVASAVNARANEIAYTSFEADGKGNWSFTGSTQTNPAAITGAKIYPLSGGSISRVLNSANTYIVSFWKQGTVNVSGGTVYRTGRTINGWTYLEYQCVNTETISISGSGNIDELRLFPKNAQMNTYTYKPLVGITSQSDANGNILYYEYDAFGRLVLVRDTDRNVVKTMEYKYKADVGE